MCVESELSKHPLRSEILQARGASEQADCLDLSLQLRLGYRRQRKSTEVIDSVEQAVYKFPALIPSILLVGHRVSPSITSYKKFQGRSKDIIPP
jgi:hypothetical protein